MRRSAHSGHVRLPHYRCVDARSCHRLILPIILKHRLSHFSMTHALKVLVRKAGLYIILKHIRKYSCVTRELPRQSLIFVHDACRICGASEADRLLGRRATNVFTATEQPLLK